MTTTIPALDLNAAGMLCYVRVAVWSARKLDRKQTDKTNRSAKASSGASRVNKHLLVDADQKLRAVSRKGAEIRNYIEAHTLPWDNAGYRLLDNAGAVTVVGEVQTLVNEFNALVDEFIDEYPVLRAKALASLGDMANDDDYPRPDQVRQKFGVDLTFSPIPTGFGGSRYGMNDAVLAVWESNFRNTVVKQQNAAIRGALQRLQTNLERYSERLQLTDGKPGTFTNTMVTQLRDTVELIESLQLFGSDGTLQALVAEVKADIAAHDPEALRRSAALPVSVKNDVDDVLKRMQDYLR